MATADTMNADPTTARRNAESAYRLSPTAETLGALQIAGDAEMDEYLAGFDARHASDTYTTPDSYMAACPRPALARLIAAYSRYLDEGIAATDGHFTPLDFETWKASRSSSLARSAVYRTQGSTLRPRLRQAKEAIPFKVDPANRPRHKG
jgi:hypothetical protein